MTRCGAGLRRRCSVPSMYSRVIGATSAACSSSSASGISGPWCLDRWVGCATSAVRILCLLASVRTITRVRIDFHDGLFTY